MLARIFLNSLRKMDASRSSDPIVDSASMNALKLSLTRVSAQYILKASFSIGRSVFLARKGFRCQPQRHLDDDHAGCEEEHKQCGPPGRVQHQSFNYTLNRSVMRFVSPCNDPTSETLCPQVSPSFSDVSILGLVLGLMGKVGSSCRNPAPATLPESDLHPRNGRRLSCIGRCYHQRSGHSPARPRRGNPHQ